MKIISGVISFNDTKGFRDQMIDYFAVSVFCMRQPVPYKKCTGGMAMIAGVRIAVGKDGRIALFLPMFNRVIINGS